MAKPAHEFVIRYRSGIEVSVRADSISTKRNVATSQLTEVNWDNMHPRPMVLGIDDIESIWQVS